MPRVLVRRLLAIEWDTLAGIAAAFIAIVCSFFGLVSETTVRAILLLLCALVLLRELRNDSRSAVHAEHLDIIRQDLRDVREKVGTTDIVVITPLALRHEFRDFARHLRGHVTWHNACCRMFHRREMFESTLGLLLGNPEITTIEMLCDERERDAWDSDVATKVGRHGGAAKLTQPLFGRISSSVSFIIGEHREYERPQALMAIMDEPFASRGEGVSVPRYLFRIQNHSDILTALADVARSKAVGCVGHEEPPVHRDRPPAH